MNYAESFEQFSSRLSPMDLFLYAGAGLIIYVLFKNKLDPVKDSIIKLFNGLTSKTSNILPAVTSTVVSKPNDDLFFELVSSWKKTRDLAVRNNCPEAVKVADQMFPYLSPSGCGNNGDII